MFASIKNLIPEPRQAEQPRTYVGRHRQPETITGRAAVTMIPGPPEVRPESELDLPAAG